MDELARATNALCDQSAVLGVRVKEVEASVAGAVEAAQAETCRAARVETALALLEPQLHALHASVAHFEEAWPRLTAERSAAQEEAARQRFDAQGVRARLAEVTSAHARLEKEMESRLAEVTSAHARLQKEMELELHARLQKEMHARLQKEMELVAAERLEYACPTACKRGPECL